MINYFISTIFIVLTSWTAFAAPELSVREEALKENGSIDQKAYKKTIQASEAQQAEVESFLKLKDPTPELRNRPWLWSFAFKLQSFKPMGVGSVSNTTFALEDYGAILMPSVDFGFILPLSSETWKWGTGLAVHAGYTAQRTALVTPSGYTFEDARLNSGLFSLVWNNRIRHINYPKWTALMSPEYGVVNYTQTSVSNAQANFTQKNSYWGLSLGAEYAVTKKWGLLAQYGYRQANAANIDTTNLQNDNFEIGTSVVW